MNPSYRLNQLVRGSLDWPIPPECGGCDRVGYRGGPDYRKQVQRLAEPVGEAGGLPQRFASLCSDCRAAVPSNRRRMSSWMVLDGPTRHARHSLKYRRNITRGDVPIPHRVEFVSSLGWPVEVVTPIPLEKNRMKELGYNQAGLVAMPLASSQPRRYMPGVISRDLETRTPVGLTTTQPGENVRGAFNARAKLVCANNIRLGVELTGAVATQTEAATAFMDAGAGSIYGLRLARALERRGLKNA